jgi:hypothetical protein
MRPDRLPCLREDPQHLGDMLAEGEKARHGGLAVSASACLGSQPVMGQEVSCGGNGGIPGFAGRVRGGAG